MICHSRRSESGLKRFERTHAQRDDLPGRLDMRDPHMGVHLRGRGPLGGSIHVGPAGMHGSLDMSDAEIDTTCFHKIASHAENQSREITSRVALALSRRLALTDRLDFLYESPAKAMRLSWLLSKPRHEDGPIQHSGT